MSIDYSGPLIWCRCLHWALVVWFYNISFILVTDLRTSIVLLIFNLTCGTIAHALSLDPCDDVADRKGHHNGEGEKYHEHECSTVAFVPAELRAVVSVAGLCTPIDIEQHAFRQSLLPQCLNRLFTGHVCTAIHTPFQLVVVDLRRVPQTFLVAAVFGLRVTQAVVFTASFVQVYR